MVKEVTTKRGAHTPIVFCAVQDPVNDNIVASEESSGNHITGSAAEPVSKHLEQISLLLSIKPNIKKIALPYNPTAEELMENELIKIEDYLSKKDIQAVRVEIFHTNEIVEKLSQFLDEVDVVLLLRDATIMGGIESIVKLGNKYGVAVFCSDTYAISKGAALAFGGDDAVSGESAAKKALLILEENKKPTEIPITTPNYQYKLYLNKQTMKSQGLADIDPRLLFLIEYGELVDTLNEKIT